MSKQKIAQELAAVRSRATETVAAVDRLQSALEEHEVELIGDLLEIKERLEGGAPKVPN